jgi:hypothetical protein
MGTGVVLEMVERGQEFRGVLLQSPFSTYSDAVGEIIATVVSRWIVLGMSGGDTLDNVENIRGAFAGLCLRLRCVRCRLVVVVDVDSLCTARRTRKRARA